MNNQTNVNVKHEVQPPVSDEKKLRRRIEDYLRKYASTEQLEEVAELLGMKTN